MRATRIRYWVLAGLCLVGLIAYIHRVGFSSAGTYLKKDLEINDQDWSVVMAAFLVAYAVFEVPWGLLGDRFGARHVLALITLAWSGLTAALGLLLFLPRDVVVAGFALPVAVLIVLRFAFGLFQAGAFPAISRVIADWLPLPERGTAQGVMWMSCRLGGALSPFLLVWLVIDLGGWANAFMAVALLGVAYALVFWWLFRNRPESMKAVNAAELDVIARGRDRPTGHYIPWREMLQSRSVWALCFMYGFGGFSGNFFITLLPAYLREHRHLPPQTMTWLQGLPLACGVVGCLVGGLFSDWLIRSTGNRVWGRRLSGMIGHSLAGLMLLATNWVTDVWALGVLLCATFFCNDLAMGPAWACCADIGERAAGTVGGAMNTIGNLGGALGVLITGSLLGRVVFLMLGAEEYLFAGNELVFVIFAVSYWLAALCWLGVDVTKPLGRRH
jgi:sugar phosphate permease